MFFVYIIYSPSTDSFYKGQTSDFNERLKRHNSLAEKATASGVPWQAIWVISKPTRSEAIILESKIKNLSRAKLISFMHKYAEGIVGPDALLLLNQWSGC